MVCLFIYLLFQITPVRLCSFEVVLWLVAKRFGGSEHPGCRLYFKKTSPNTIHNFKKENIQKANFNCYICTYFLREGLNTQIISSRESQRANKQEATMCTANYNSLNFLLPLLIKGNTNITFYPQRGAKVTNVQQKLKQKRMFIFTKRVTCN